MSEPSMDFCEVCGEQDVNCKCRTSDPDAPAEEIPKLCVNCQEFLAEDEDFEGVLVMINPQVQEFLTVYSKERQDLYPPEVGPAPLGKVIGDIMETMGKAAGWPQ